MKCVARAPGTCGELAQGTSNDINFLVTCPINLYSVASVELTEGSEGIRVNGGRIKTAAAVEKLLEFVGVKGLNVSITIESDIPAGKGMASSTADITAACTAVAEALGKKISSADLAGIALSVEPTDGLMFPGIMVFDHVRGLTRRTLAGIPEIDLLVVDIGGTVDTREFNARVNLKLLNRLNEPIVAKALELVEKGIEEKDLNMIAEGATISAFANQKILEKPLLSNLHGLCFEYGGLGINVAHSGTVVGLMFEREKEVDWTGLISRIKEMNIYDVMGPFKIVSGGAEVLKERGGRQVWQPYYHHMGGISALQRRSMD